MSRSRRSSFAFVKAFGLALLAVTMASCANDGFGRAHNPPHLEISLDANRTPAGTREKPLALVVGKPSTFRVTVRALTPEGALDTTVNRYVRLSAKPGSILPISGENSASDLGRNVVLVNGESASIDIRVVNAFGTTHIVADDLGYTPADPLRVPPPACANGIDDDRDGRIDFPDDDGCAFANDDDELGGTYAVGISPPLFFDLPRIADVRGLACESAKALGDAPSCSGGGVTPYSKQPVQVDTGYRDNGSFAFDTVVTRIASNGFFVTDVGDSRGGFKSLFAFNFNAPPRMRTCDRLKTYGGTASEFFGFTQLAYPTWTLEEWDPARRRCLVPEPQNLGRETLNDSSALLRISGDFVRVGTGAETVRVTPKFGPGDVPKTPNGTYLPTAEASNCDFDRNGVIKFVANDPEAACSTACTADPECTEWSNYLSRGTFRLTVTDAARSTSAIQANASAAPEFDPQTMKGKPLRSFAGTLTYFSGGAQYTIEARCPDDITTDVNAAPFVSDSACTSDQDCTAPPPGGLGLPPVFTCVALTEGKACRRLDAARPSVREPPPLACVFPRTFLDNNPQ